MSNQKERLIGTLDTLRGLVTSLPVDDWPDLHIQITNNPEVPWVITVAANEGVSDASRRRVVDAIAAAAGLPEPQQQDDEDDPTYAAIGTGTEWYRVIAEGCTA